MENENVERALKSIFKNQLGIWGPHGSGKTVLLKRLQPKLDNAFYVHIHSFRMPLGELFFSILSTNWQKGIQLDKRSWSTFLRYIPKTDIPLDIDVKPTYFVDSSALARDVLLSTMTLLEAYDIKTLLIDQLDPVEIDDTVKYLLEQLPKEGITVIATSTYQDALLQIEYPSMPLRFPKKDNSDLIKQYMEMWHLDEKEAARLLNISGGNLFNAQLLIKTHASSLDELVEQEMKQNPDLFRALAYLSVGDLWFSSISKNLVEENFLSGEHSLLDSPLIMEEAPQYRFISPEVKQLVREKSKLEPKEASLWWGKALSKLGMPTYWHRISHLFKMAEEKRSQAFALLMASRYELDFSAKAQMLQDALTLFPHLGGAKRKLMDVYYSSGQYEEAYKLSKSLENPTFFDLAHQVRLLVLLGMNEEATISGEALLRRLKENIDPFYWPGMLSDLAVYIINIKQEPQLLYDFYIDLVNSHVKAPKMHWGAFLNTVGAALDATGKYEDAIKCYRESMKLLNGTSHIDVYSRPLINEIALKTVIYGAKTVLESKEQLENVVENLSSISQQGFWETLLVSLQEFMAREGIQRYVKGLEENTRRLYSAPYKFNGYMTLAWHYANVLDFNLAEWFLILASKNALSETENLNAAILSAYLKILEGSTVDNSVLDELEAKALKLLPKGIDVANLVALLLMAHHKPIPAELLAHLDSSPYQEALRFIATEGTNGENIFRYMLALWRRWERLSMSNLGIVISKCIENNYDPSILKTLSDWILEEMRTLDYSQLIGYWQDIYGSITAMSQWSSFLGWHLNIQEIINVEQLNGALAYIFHHYFKQDYFVRVESGTLNLEFGDSRVLMRNVHPIEKGAVVKIKAWYDYAEPIVGPALDLLSYSLEQLMSKLFGMQDPLTGLFNRNYSNQRLKEEWELYLRGGPNFSILFMDLDDFKQINDNYSHEMGDKVLIEFANFLRSSLRGTDAAIRWGGDEFLVVLPDTEISEAMEIAKRISSQLKLKNSAIGRPITVSVGYAASSEVSSPEELLNLADRRVYILKAEKAKRIREL
ncbi:GGDEF domain-containing protein [Coprothermobacter platensis]|uniref:GGDEF domain-containing protein n=1 Tax=Coprothermobacter platensis TaxID=108819 RepID=UPI0003601C02|nr:GGDEF domain-containing protein [Coprothermobacter platensis]